jgi:hypothetical protein
LVVVEGETETEPDGAPPVEKPVPVQDDPFELQVSCELVLDGG